MVLRFITAARCATAKRTAASSTREQICAPPIATREFLLPGQSAQCRLSRSKESCKELFNAQFEVVLRPRNLRK